MKSSYETLLTSTISAFQPCIWSCAAIQSTFNPTRLVISRSNFKLSETSLGKGSRIGRRMP